MSKRAVLRNTNDTISSFLVNDATVARTWRLPDIDINIAGREDLGFYNRQMQYGVEPGVFTIMIGPDSASGMETTIEAL